MAINHITRTEINIGARAAPLIARVNRRAKRLILKVDPVAGEIHVTAPSKRALPEAIRFAHERIDWIASQLTESLRGKPFVAGGKALFLGVEHIVKLTQHLVRREDLVAYRDIRARHLGDCEPASMLTFLPGLVWPEMLIELEVVAAD